MEVRDINTLRENPHNYKVQTEREKRELLKQMQMGDHSTFLITADGMVIDGNHRLVAAIESGWEKAVCRILTAGQDPTTQKYYAIIDGQPVKFHEVIPYFYDNLEQMYLAYAMSRNSHASYYDFEELANLELPDPSLFSIDIRPIDNLQTLLDKVKDPPPLLDICPTCQQKIRKKKETHVEPPTA